MDTQDLPVEFDRSINRLDKTDLRTELSTGWGATTGGLALSQRYHERLTEGVRLACLDAHKGTSSEAPLVIMLRKLPDGVIALSAIQTVLHSVGLRETFRETLIKLGSAIADELWAQGLVSANDHLSIRVAKAVRARRTTKTRYEKARALIAEARTKLGSENKQERETAESLVSFKERQWSRPALVTAGGWLWNVVASSLPEVFERVPANGGEYMLTITQDGWDIVDSALDHAVVNNPIFWPEPNAPKPWTEFANGGSNDPRVGRYVSVLRSHHKATHAAVKHAIRTGTMKPALDALNALQAVPFTINTKVLEVIHECTGYQLPVKGLPPKNLEPVQKPNAFAWADMSDAEKRLWKIKRHETNRTNTGFVGDRVLFKLDMKIADDMVNHPQFFTPMNLDWRGRVYGLTHFNFQREDRVRALFLFAEGQPIGDEGIRWLKIHTANCGDFSKISKQTLEARVQWCNDNTQLITNIASAPLVHTEWMQADKPFLFLAACFELRQALQQGSAYLTRLPISFDGSCSGLQHLCAMTKASEGSMVNLTQSPLPQDVYQQVADDTFAAIALDLDYTPDPEAKDPEKEAKKAKDVRAMARLFLDYKGDRRKAAKRNVMTYSYSSKKFGMAAQQQMDLMEPLAREVLEGKLAEHPFVGYNFGPSDKFGMPQPSKAARYFAGHVFEAIEKRIHKPAEAMKFLQAIAKRMAHEGKPVTWTTPVGIPWINRYHAPTLTRVNLYLAQGSVKERVRVSVATGSEKEIDKDKAANGVAPNVVHACDASHLLLVANASILEGVTSIATVHDSFGCLAPQATRFNKIIREQFALMYETHDVLTEILERASCDLTDANRNRLPTRPEDGPLNLKDILNADFAFA